MSEDFLRDNEAFEGKKSEINFLKSKLEWEKEKIEEHMEDYPENIEPIVKEEFKEELEATREHLKKDNIEFENEEGIDTENPTIGEELSAEINFLGHPLIYYTDSFMLDLKRCIEFALRFTRAVLNPNKKGEQFKFENFLNHIEEDSDDTKSKFVRQIEESCPWYKEYILEEIGWLWKVKWQRTRLAHKELDFGFEEIEFNRYWEGEFRPDEEPDEVEKPEELIFDGMEIIESLELHLDKLEKFLDKTSTVGNTFQRKREIEDYIGKFY